VAYGNNLWHVYKLFSAYFHKLSPWKLMKTILLYFIFVIQITFNEHFYDKRLCISLLLRWNSTFKLFFCWFNSGQAEKEFRVEVEAIGHVRHKNLVRLLGFCVEGTHRYPYSQLHQYDCMSIISAYMILNNLLS
jgi:hypothetical protein